MSDDTEFDPETDPDRQLYPSVGWGKGYQPEPDEKEK